MADALCDVCGSITHGAPLCQSCAGKLRCARQKAARLSDDEKRDMARQAVVALMQRGRVKVRLLR